MIFQELASTEQNYVTLLEAFLENYILPLSARMQGQGQSDGAREGWAELTAIFQSIQQLIPLHRTLSQTLHALEQSWAQDGCLGQVFTQLVPSLVVYATYNVQYNDAREAYDLFVGDKPTAEFISQCDHNAKKKGHPLSSIASYLILPIQRLPRYSLLLGNLLGHTPALHPDHEALAESVLALESVNSHIDEALSEARRSRKVLGIQKRFGLPSIAGLGSQDVLWGGDCSVACFDSLRPADSESKSKHAEASIFVFSACLLLVYHPKKQSRRQSMRRAAGTKKQDAQGKARALTVDNSLVWVRESGASVEKGQQQTVLHLTVPLRSLLITFRSKDEKGSFYNTLTTQISRCCIDIVSKHKISAHTLSDDLVFRYGRYSHSGPVPWVYEGWWLLGLRHGKGCLQLLGSSYEGEFFNNLRQGTGVLIFSSGEKYTGEFHDDEIHGTGVLEFSDGSTYAGSFEHGIRAGFGLLKSPSVEYSGQWLENLPHGSGILTVTSQLSSQVFSPAFSVMDATVLKLTRWSYDGEWSLGLPHGQGEIFTTLGYSYRGGFRYGRYHSQGVLTDGLDFYQGEFQYGLRQGQGTNEKSCQPNAGEPLIYEVYQGAYLNNMRHGKGKVTFRDGSSYEGDWENDLFHGTGTYSTLRITYTGGYRRGLRHGRGVITFSSAEQDPSSEWSFSGQFERNHPNGLGTWITSDGVEVEGTWSEATLNTKAVCQMLLPNADPSHVPVPLVPMLVSRSLIKIDPDTPSFDLSPLPPLDTLSQLSLTC
ncbi:MAG: hypothetical protein Q8P67_25210 [archaeon]|nr:hypothetical protein [archaeon]